MNVYINDGLTTERVAIAEDAWAYATALAGVVIVVTYGALIAFAVFGFTL